MFGFTPKPPISEKACVWIAQSFDRFERIFGAEVLRAVPVALPTPEFFPEEWDGSADGVVPVLQRVCGYMDVDPKCIELVCRHPDDDPDVGEKLKEILPYWEGARAGAAGSYLALPKAETFRVTVTLTRKPDLFRLIGTLAHEVGHVHLLGSGHVERDAPDMEPLTDLVTVFWGLGLFTANSAMKFTQHDDGTKHGWSVQRLGYLPEPMYGFALAEFARRRGEERPGWAKHLNVNLAGYFRQSVKYLRHRAAAAPRKIGKSKGGDDE